MSIQFRCLVCRLDLSVDDSRAAVRLRCPRCNADLTVPAASQAALTTALRPAPPAVPPPLQSSIIAPMGTDSAAPAAPVWIIGTIASVVLALAGYLAFRALPTSEDSGPSDKPGGSVADKKDEPEPARDNRLAKAEDTNTPKPTPSLDPEPVKRDEPPAKTISPPEPTPPSDPPKSEPIKTEEPKKEPPARPEKNLIGRIEKLDSETLRKQLLALPDVSLDAVPNTSRDLLTVAQNLQRHNQRYPGPVILGNQRADLALLPFRRGADAQLGKEPADNLQALSRKLRVHIQACIPPDDIRPDADKLRDLLLSKKSDWVTSGSVPVLMQMLQAERSDLRKLLVELLGQIKGRSASEALAIRAVTDLDREVRELATRELKNRPLDEYGNILLTSLRYPWAPVALHAAETIATLDLKELVPGIITLMSQADPNAPGRVRLGQRTLPVMREVVRINHLGNCVLCHAPSFSRDEPVRGAVPTPGLPLPAPATTPQYYEAGGIFVRADITYLRQDFSVIQPVENHGAWPEHQRYDYLVRLRPLTYEQFTRLSKQYQELKTTPHQEAMLFALRELTGKDLGNKPSDWLALLPANKRPKEKTLLTTDEDDWKRLLPDNSDLTIQEKTDDPGELADMLRSGDAKEQERLLKKVRGNPSDVQTAALAQALAKLEGPVRDRARDLLVDRLSRLPGKDLAGRLQSDQAEMRRAAALASASRKDLGLVPALIRLLDDRNAEVVQAARKALCELSGEDFGPKPDADNAQRDKAVQDWVNWWKKRR